ncbi:methyltransferase domain-containing protein [Nocardiopsis sp. RSe5-2]|uniref:Protein-L-isoaspartate O-methyltransferase n=1 Tax=Nocardiopsis endophytica TaxID=3018445 RepID=A0ABT4TXC4_9ACTN|nr:methyltransferase domain-containing protein [Nocardiopsis endophytica]MDA2809336.1 methyltransferase domain-containing protein [Nocardiopsis endophytica]
MNAAPGARIARALTSKGEVLDPAWHRAVLAVDRSAFIPETVWIRTTRQGRTVFAPYPRTDADVSRWIHQDYALMTQVDDGEPAGPDGTGIVPTSSISQPSLVAAMLQALDTADRDRVLEVGTGTGYNLALLCERLGDDRVVSIEVDPGVAERARRTLAELGYKPTIITGDGAAGVPDHGPFDHVLATVGAKQVPPAWLEQVRPGGRIVTPWGPGYTSAALLRLVVGEDGAARGRMLRDAAFMWLRDQRRAVDSWRDHIDEAAPGTAAGETALNPRTVSDPDPGWGVVLGHLVPGLVAHVAEAADDATDAVGEATVRLYDRAGSWATAEYTPAGPPYETLAGGARDLWAEVAAARAAWERAGRPGRDRLGVTVHPDGRQDLWLDTPDRVLTA